MLINAAGRSAWSRRGPILEISDVSKKEALHYLDSRGIDNELALKIYELVGGRLVHLVLVADDIKVRNKSFEGTYSIQKTAVSHYIADTRCGMLRDASAQFQ